MNTESLKLNIVQQILNLSDIQILEQVKNLLNGQNIIGYEADGTPITKNQYLSDMADVEREIQSGTIKTYSTDEARDQIFGKK
jgi:hypothetical protein